MKSSAEFRQLARQRLRGKWGLSLAVSLVAAIFGCYGGISINLSADSFEQLASLSGSTISIEWLTAALNVFGPIISLFALAQLVLGGAVQVGLCCYYNRLIRNEAAEFADLFSRFALLGKALLLSLYTGLLVFLWSLLFIIPGIVAGYRYSLAFYLLCDHPEYSVRQCVNESKRLMAGHKGRLFSLQLSFIGWALLSALTLGIGNLWLNPYISAATSAFYLERAGADAFGSDWQPQQSEPEFVPNDPNGPQQL